MPQLCLVMVKSVDTGYDNYLQKIKRNTMKNTKSLPNQTICKGCYSFIKNIGTPTYDTHLNNIKSNIVKNKSNIGLNLDCKCKTDQM